MREKRPTGSQADIGGVTYRVSGSGDVKLTNVGSFPSFATFASNPYWKSEVSRHINASRPYSSSFVKIIAQPRLSITWLPKNGSGYVNRVFSNSTLLGSLRPPSLANSTLTDMVTKKFKSKVSNGIGLYNAAIPVAELRELRSGAASMADSLAKITKSNIGLLNRRGFKWTKRSVIEAVADGWLQWSFGISPTLSSIRDANLAISKFLSREDHIVRYTSRASMSNNWTPRTVSACPHDLYNHGWTLMNKQTTSALETHYMTGAFDLKLRSSNDYSATNVFSLNPSTIIPLFYELTAFSWVLDYFTTVGDYLNDEILVDPGSIIYLTLSRKRESFVTDSPTPIHFSFNAGKTLSFSSAPGSYVIRQFDRQSLSTIPSRIVRFKTIDEIGLHGFNKLANLLAVQSSLAQSKGVRVRL